MEVGKVLSSGCKQKGPDQCMESLKLRWKVPLLPNKIVAFRAQ